ncbi:MAG: divergent polysaccharide deacetylase family protein [Deltaproteobacteria bacterium]|nr:divergent polysaccharide deacetylase family protein [Deltaproteobacteria bacterium]
MPKLALIIDDGGYNIENFKEMLGTGKRITYAILPNTPHAREAALMAYRDGSEVMLHLPMEPKEEEWYSLEKDTVRTGMDAKRVQKILEDALKQVPHVRGVNNHMGSKATEDPQVMETLMQVLKKEGLYFIDSHTSFQTLGPEMARKVGVASRRNDKFIDREKKIEAIKNAIRLAMRKAKQEGRAVAIGHPHPLTARAIKEMISEIEKEGIRLVFASEVVG